MLLQIFCLNSQIFYANSEINKIRTHSHSMFRQQKKREDNRFILCISSCWCRGKAANSINFFRVYNINI